MLRIMRIQMAHNSYEFIARPLVACDRSQIQHLEYVDSYIRRNKLQEKFAKTLHNSERNIFLQTVKLRKCNIPNGIYMSVRIQANENVTETT